MMLRQINRAALLACCCLGLLASAQAADNQLTEKEKQEGWQLLFNGKDFTGWKCNNDKEIASVIEQNALVPYKSGGYLIVYEKPFSDFIFRCDVLMPEKCNSGVFFRVEDLKNPVMTGFEAQVMTSDKPSYHSFGAIYDLVPCSSLPLNGPGKWDTVEITCKGGQIDVAVNGKVVSALNYDDFPEPGKRPDGTDHKFKRAIKDFARSGYLGFQDHGHKVWYKNVKIKDLSAK